MVFRKKKQEDAVLKILLAVCEALPAEFDYIRHQIEDQRAFWVHPGGMIVNKGSQNIKKEISMQAKYADKAGKRLTIDHIFICDFEKKRHKILIEIEHGLLIGCEIYIDQIEQADPEGICAKNHKVKYHIYKWESLFTDEELGYLKPIKDLDVRSIYEVYLDDKLYYWLFDLTDSDFIAMDTEKNIYQVTHDPYEISLMEEDLLALLKMITAHRQSENDSNIEQKEIPPC